MKQSFSHIPQRGTRTGRRRLLAVTVLVVAVYLLDVFTGGVVRGQVHKIAAVAHQAGSQVASAVSGSGAFSTKASLEAHNKSLVEQLSAMQEKIAYADALKAENDELRALLSLAQERRGITAPVVSSVRSSPYGTFLIGAGEAEGVVEGSLVVSAGGFALGVVSESDAHTSVVKYLFAPGAPIEGSVHGSPILLTGAGGANAEADVPRGLAINAGDPVLAPQYSGRPIGVVGSVASSSSSAAQHVLVRLPMNISGLRFVYVLSN